MSPNRNEIQRQIHMMRKTINRLKVLMSRETNEEKWISLASKHGELTLLIQEMREELKDA